MHELNLNIDDHIQRGAQSKYQSIMWTNTSNFFPILKTLFKKGKKTGDSRNTGINFEDPWEEIQKLSQ